MCKLLGSVSVSRRPLSHSRPRRVTIETETVHSGWRTKDREDPHGKWGGWRQKQGKGGRGWKGQGSGQKRDGCVLRAGGLMRTNVKESEWGGVGGRGSVSRGGWRDWWVESVGGCQAPGESLRGGCSDDSSNVPARAKSHTPEPHQFS